MLSGSRPRTSHKIHASIGSNAASRLGSDVEKEEKAESVSHESFVSEMVESSEVDMERAGIDLKAKVRRERCLFLLRHQMLPVRGLLRERLVKMKCGLRSTPRSEAGQKEPGKDQSLSAPEVRSLLRLS